jgi:hypothetical protein
LQLGVRSFWRGRDGIFYTGNGSPMSMFSVISDVINHC